MNKNTYLIVIIALVGLIFYIISGGSNSGSASAQNDVEIRNGVQYVTVNAGGGYSPKISYAKAGIPTKLIMKTNGALDCSSSLVIRAINYQNILPQTGETEIDLGTPSVGQRPIQGVCGMGMYNFQIQFD